eukprot:Rhum_TRINITY_DN12152_c0_g1::Rhum_TRINITY_DN12152_c0_g1_i1::g.49627::m.49627
MRRGRSLGSLRRVLVAPFHDHHDLFFFFSDSACFLCVLLFLFLLLLFIRLEGGKAAEALRRHALLQRQRQRRCPARLHLPRAPRDQAREHEHLYPVRFLHDVHGRRRVRRDVLQLLHGGGRLLHGALRPREHAGALAEGDVVLHANGLAERNDAAKGVDGLGRGVHHSRLVRPQLREAHDVPVVRALVHQAQHRRTRVLPVDQVHHSLPAAVRLQRDHHLVPRLAERDGRRQPRQRRRAAAHGRVPTAAGEDAGRACGAEEVGGGRRGAEDAARRADPQLGLQHHPRRLVPLPHDGTPVVAEVHEVRDGEVADAHLARAAARAPLRVRLQRVDVDVAEARRRRDHGTAAQQDDADSRCSEGGEGAFGAVHERRRADGPVLDGGSGGGVRLRELPRQPALLDHGVPRVVEVADGRKADGGGADRDAVRRVEEVVHALADPCALVAGQEGGEPPARPVRRGEGDRGDALDGVALLLRLELLAEQPVPPLQQRLHRLDCSDGAAEGVPRHDDRLALLQPLLHHRVRRVVGVARAARVEPLVQLAALGCLRQACAPDVHAAEPVAEVVCTPVRDVDGVHVLGHHHGRCPVAARHNLDAALEADQVGEVRAEEAEAVQRRLLGVPLVRDLVHVFAQRRRRCDPPPVVLQRDERAGLVGHVVGVGGCRVARRDVDMLPALALLGGAAAAFTDQRGTKTHRLTQVLHVNEVQIL